MISKEDFRKMESEYNTWLARHPKGDHNYKSFSHMRRSIEFAKYYNDKQVKRINSCGETLKKCNNCDVVSKELINNLREVAEELELHNEQIEAGVI